MTSKFIDRVNLERKALDVINSSLPGCSPLVGLASRTMSLWLVEVASAYPDVDVDRLSKSLDAVSEAARSKADVSDEVFVEIERQDADAAMSSLVRDLKEIL